MSEPLGLDRVLETNCQKTPVNGPVYGPENALVSKGILHPDPYHGAPPVVDRLRHTPCPGYPTMLHGGRLPVHPGTPAVSEANHRSPGFFWLQWPG